MSDCKSLDPAQILKSALNAQKHELVMIPRWQWELLKNIIDDNIPKACQNCPNKKNSYCHCALPGINQNETTY